MGLCLGVQDVYFQLLSKAITFTALDRINSAVHTFNWFDWSGWGTLMVTCALHTGPSFV